MSADADRETTPATIRPFRVADVAAVTKILQEAPEAAAWAETSLEELLGWAGAMALVSEADGNVCGFLIGRQIGDEAEVLNVGVSVAQRRRGEATALLQCASDEFQVRGVKRVFLEVRESNDAAIGFYSKHGFSKTGRRPGYYREPPEAAVLMEKKLTG